MTDLQNLQIVVTGTGRCGTKYMGAMLTGLGIPCRHEFFGSIKRCPHFKRGQIDWRSQHPAESSWLLAPWIDDFPGYVLHVTRDPKRVVNSMIWAGALQSPWLDYMIRFAGDWPCETPEDRVIWAYRFWVVWNDMIRKALPSNRYACLKIEQASDLNVRKILQGWGFDPLRKRVQLSPKMNSRTKRWLHGDQEHRRFARCAGAYPTIEAYGYDLDRREPIRVKCS